MKRILFIALATVFVASSCRKIEVDGTTKTDGGNTGGSENTILETEH